MSPFFRQLGALVWLTSKQMGRRAMRAGEAPRTGKPTAALLVGVSYLYLVGVLYNLGKRVGDLGAGRVSALRLVAWSLFGMALSTAMIWSAPQIGRIRPVLRSAFLELLPVSGGAKAVIAWLQGFAFIVAAPVLYFTAAPEACDTAGGVVFVILLALLGSIAGSLLGQGLSALSRASNSALLVRVFPWLGVVLAFGPFAALLNAPTLGPRLSEEGRDPMLYVARALLEDSASRFVVLALYAAVAALAGLLLWGSERIGYDREDRPAGARYKRSVLGSPMRVELRLLWRQGTSKMLVFQTVMMTALGVLVVAMIYKVGGKHGAKDEEELRPLLLGLISQITLFTSLTLFNVAGAAIARDLQARPFLSALPTTPAQTLDHKARALRLLTIPVFLVLAVIAGALVVRSPTIGLAIAGPLMIRVVLVAVGLWLVCGMAAPIAFLTRGLGANEGARQGMPPIIVSALIFLPLLSIMLVPSWPQALASLLVLAALAFEARRAAARCVTWIDDGGETERDTPVWRALLALGGFFAAQGLAGQALSFLPVSDGIRLAFVYLASGIVLVVLTWRARPPAVTRTSSPFWDLGGLCAGVASGGAAMLFALAIRKLGLDGAGPEIAGPAARIAVALAVVVVAPLCEELFFRGWLQAAIAKELGPRARWAPLLGACAFAGAHVGSAIVPQFVLGLVAGLLFARTGRLRPGILAHAAHNGVVALLGMT